MSVELTLRAVEIFRSFGVPVTFEPGWDRRGNGQSSAYQGGIVHHTGGAYNATCPGILIYGRSDLSGPLCNFAGLSGGGIHVVAAHPANHAGASGGPSNGPFPRTTLFNRLVMGLEICYPGNTPMTDAEYHTAKVFAYAMKVLFGDIERARGHAETSVEGKWDPGYSPGRTISMSGFRSDALNFQEGEDEMSWDTPIPNHYGKEPPAGVMLAYIDEHVNQILAEQAAQRALLAESIENPDITVERFEQVVRDAGAAANAAHLAAQQAQLDASLEVVREIVGARDAELADEVVDEIGRRTNRAA